MQFVKEIEDLFEKSGGWYGYFLQHYYPIANRNYNLNGQFDFVAKGKDGIFYQTLKNLGRVAETGTSSTYLMFELFSRGIGRRIGHVKEQLYEVQNGFKIVNVFDTEGQPLRKNSVLKLTNRNLSM